MSGASPRGNVYRCPVCGAEIAVLARRHGAFAPRCCRRPMVPVSRRMAFYVCPVCGAEVGLLRRGRGEFAPRCCGGAMRREAA
jgi:DNA-directed RNA polymerase subunit RPC12/RpoP